MVTSVSSPFSLSRPDIFDLLSLSLSAPHSQPPLSPLNRLLALNFMALDGLHYGPQLQSQSVESEEDMENDDRLQSWYCD